MERDAEVVAKLVAERPEEEVQQLWRKNLRMVVHERAAKPKGRQKLLHLMS